MLFPQISGLENKDLERVTGMCVVILPQVVMICIVPDISCKDTGVL